MTFVLPVLLQPTRQQAFPSRSGLLEFIWIIRRKADIGWIKAEEELLAAAESCPNSNFQIRAFVTREGEVQVSSGDGVDVGVGKEVVTEGIRLRAESTSTTSADGEGLLLFCTWALALRMQTETGRDAPMWARMLLISCRGRCMVR